MKYTLMGDDSTVKKKESPKKTNTGCKGKVTTETGKPRGRYDQNVI